MKILKTKGYVAIEVVITASFILAVGFFALLNFSSSGTNLMDTVNGRLAGLGIFGGGSTTEETIVYDENGYPEHLNIDPADVTPEENFIFLWDDANNGWSVRWYQNDDGRDTVIIPARLADGLPVVSIPEGGPGFDRPHITTIVLPNTIKSIGNWSLNYLNVESLIIPNSVTSIGEGAFWGSAIETIILPSYITRIEEHTFLNVPLKEIRIPDGVTFIGKHAFADPYGFDNHLIHPLKITLSKNLETIGEGAFRSTWLKPISLPDNIDVGVWAFGNSVLEGVSIGRNSTVDEYAFYGSSIDSISFSEGLFVGYSAFYESIIENISFGKNTTIDEHAFYLSHIDSISLSEGLTIHAHAFGEANLKSVEFKRDTTIGEWAFGQSTLESVAFSESGSTTIGPWAFYGNQLTSVSIPSSIERIEDGAFLSNQLTSVVIPNSVTHLWTSAFRDNNLTEVTFLGSLPALHTSTSASDAVFGNGSGVNTTIPANGIKVPSAHLTTYRNNASKFGVVADRFVGQ